MLGVYENGLCVLWQTLPELRTTMFPSGIEVSLLCDRGSAQHGCHRIGSRSQTLSTSIPFLYLKKHAGDNSETRLSLAQWRNPLGATWTRPSFPKSGHLRAHLSNLEPSRVLVLTLVLSGTRMMLFSLFLIEESYTKNSKKGMGRRSGLNPNLSSS